MMQWISTPKVHKKKKGVQIQQQNFDDVVL